MKRAAALLTSWTMACASSHSSGEAAPPEPAEMSGASGVPSDSLASGGRANADCEREGLVWKTGHKTHYESYPDPGSVECVQYNGCEWAGWFAGCSEQQTKEWVASHDIAAIFPGFEAYLHHDLCIRAKDRSMVVTVYDTCGDSDCDGCCTRNRGEADALIDLEIHTNRRWGLADGAIQWADLGPTKEPACTPN